MLHGFKDYLLDMGKSENTAAAYLRDAKLFLVWCKDSFGDEPKLLHRANIQEYISYMRNVRGYHPKTVNHQAGIPAERHPVCCGCHRKR